MSEAHQAVYRHSLLFPSAKAYSVADVLTFMSAAEYPCNHETVEKSTPSSSGLSVGVEQFVNQSAGNTEVESLVRYYLGFQFSQPGCNHCAQARSAHQVYLIDRLLEAVVLGLFELRDTDSIKVNPAPTEVLSDVQAHSIAGKSSRIQAFKSIAQKIFYRPSMPSFIRAIEQSAKIKPSISNRPTRLAYRTRHWWAKMSGIFKDDLITFCAREKIHVSFEEIGSSSVKVEVTRNSDVNSVATLTAANQPLQATTVAIQSVQNNSTSRIDCESAPLTAINADQALHNVSVSCNESAVEGTAQINVSMVDEKGKHNPQDSEVHLTLKNFDQLPDTALVSVEVVAALFGCSIPTIWRRTKQGTLKAHRHGLRSTRWLVGELRQIIQENQKHTK